MESLGPLTEREHEVLVLIADGLSTLEIAARLYISKRTVETHRANLRRKLGIGSRQFDLLQYAFQARQTSPDAGR
jgi:DNA-binding CsgD family transcriptional regulator